MSVPPTTSHQPAEAFPSLFSAALIARSDQLGRGTRGETARAREACVFVCRVVDVCVCSIGIGSGWTS